MPPGRSRPPGHDRLAQGVVCLRWSGVGLGHSRKAPGPEIAGVVRLASALALASLGVPRFPLQPTLAASFVYLDLHVGLVRRTDAHRGHQISAQQGLLLRHYVKNSPHCVNPRGLNLSGMRGSVGSWLTTTRSDGLEPERRVVLTARAAGVSPAVEPSAHAGPAGALAPATSSRCCVPPTVATNAQEATRREGRSREAREEQVVCKSPRDLRSSP